MPNLLRSVVLCCLLTGVAAAEVQVQVLDQGMRYVNDTLISVADVRQRMNERLKDLAQAGIAPPQTAADRQEFLRQVVKELTGEALLIDHFTALQKRQPMIMDMARERLERREEVLGIVEEMRERARYEREIKIQLALEFFERKLPPVSPIDLREAYADMRDRGLLDRPARVRVFRILLRPTSEREVAAIAAGRRQLFVRAQEVDEALIAEHIAPLVDRWLETEPLERTALLEDFQAWLLDLPEETVADFDREARALVAAAERLAERAEGILLREDAAALIEELQRKLADAGAALFRETAKEVSMGPQAASGGDLGLIDRGTQPAAIDEVLFAEPPPQGLLGPLEVDGTIQLLYVAEREEEHRRSFAEVSGELRRMLEVQRQHEVRSRLIEQLRERALIVDLLTVEELLEGLSGPRPADAHAR